MISTILLTLSGLVNDVYAKPIVKENVVGTKLTIRLRDDIYWKLRVEQSRPDNFTQSGQYTIKTWIEKDF